MKRLEQYRLCNLVPSKGTENDWDLQVARSSNVARFGAGYPPALDLRADWWHINDQEDTGSCVGWASTDGLMRWHMVKAKKLNPDQMLSPRFTWMASKEIDEFTSRPETFIEELGTTLKASMDVLRKFGSVPEDMLPFKINTTMYKGSSKEFYSVAAQRKIAAYYNLKTNLNDWKNWLYRVGPIMAGTMIDESWDNAAKTDGYIDRFLPRTARGGHAFVICGYRRDGYFIARNSWGTSWGDNGYGYVSPEYIRSAFYSESYGIRS
jgi:C1A family cysteine protease